jgi:L,D-peptidoglycan transpeptidase YkuD (ErfK/YbiS/YcfS/YnhG family)
VRVAPIPTVGRRANRRIAPAASSVVLALATMMMSASPVEAAAAREVDVLSSGASIGLGQSLQSLNGDYGATISSRQGLVVTNGFGVELFSGGMALAGSPASLVLDASGILRLENAAGVTLWDVGVITSQPATLTIQNDGNLVLRDGTTVAWSTNSGLPNTPMLHADTGGPSQVILVTPSSGRSAAALSTYQRVGGSWERRFAPVRAYVGRGGWRLGASRREGDGTTPIGAFAMGPVAYGIAPSPGTKLAYHRLVPGDYWDEDPMDGAHYNTFRHSATTDCARRPFAGDTECLWLGGSSYRYIVVVDFNVPSKGAFGSGIFLHVSGAPTAGCVGVSSGALVPVLRWLDPTEHPAMILEGPLPLTDPRFAQVHVI